jgi:hypothetical protein
VEGVVLRKAVAAVEDALIEDEVAEAEAACIRMAHEPRM